MKIMDVHALTLELQIGKIEQLQFFKISYFADEKLPLV
jgi:hypothetical protein